jgi:transcriptional regulator with XRE-family HTH domain
MDFSLAMQVMLALRGMTQGELAEALGTNRMTMWQIKRGFTPPADMQAQIRSILNWGEREDVALAMLAGEEVAA